MPGHTHCYDEYGLCFECDKPKHPGGRPKKPASERAESVVHVRVTAARKAAYVAAAKSRGVSFSQWVQEWLDYAVDDGYRG